MRAYNCSCGYLTYTPTPRRWESSSDAELTELFSDKGLQLEGKENASLSSIPCQYVSLEWVVTSPAFSGSNTCVYVFENSYKYLCKRKIKVCNTYTFFSVLPLNGLGKRDFLPIILLLFFRQITLFSCDTVHQTLQKNSLPTLPQQTPNNQSSQLLYFFFPPFYFFLKRRKITFSSDDWVHFFLSG